MILVQILNAVIISAFIITVSQSGVIICSLNSIALLGIPVSFLGYESLNVDSPSVSQCPERFLITLLGLPLYRFVGTVLEMSFRK